MMNTEDALLDLAQLEELQKEAEKMKALGNKHMAAQVSTVQNQATTKKKKTKKKKTKRE